MSDYPPANGDDGPNPTRSLRRSNSVDEIDTESAPSLRKRISRSFKWKKKKDDLQRLSIPADSEPSSSNVSISSVKTEGDIEESSGGGKFKKFLRSTIRRRRPKSESIPSPPGSPSQPHGSMERRVLPEFFQSKIDPLQWVNRGGEHVTLSSCVIEEMSSLEVDLFRKFAFDRLNSLLSISLQELWMSKPEGRASQSNKFSLGRMLSVKKPKSSISQPKATPSTSSFGLAIPLGNVFGVSLTTLLEADRQRTGDMSLRIPSICASMINYLEKEAINVEGIFRVNGNHKRMKGLIDAFSNYEEPQYDQYAPSDVATLLKKFFSNLPQPLLTYQFYSAFLNIKTLETTEEQLLALRLLCALLPTPNRYLLQALLALLGRIAQVSDRPSGNQMNSNNLAKVFAPNLLKSDTSSPTRPDDLESADVASSESSIFDVIEMMIDYSDLLFIVTAEIRTEVLAHHQFAEAESFNSLIRDLISGVSYEHSEGTDVTFRPDQDSADTPVLRVPPKATLHDSPTEEKRGEFEVARRLSKLSLLSPAPRKTEDDVFTAFHSDDSHRHPSLGSHQGLGVVHDETEEDPGTIV